MSQRVESGSHTARGIGAAIAGVAFSDFIGLLFLGFPVVGWIFAAAFMVGLSTWVAWLALEGRSNRAVLTVAIGLANVTLIFLAAIALFVLAFATLFEVLGEVRFG